MLVVTRKLDEKIRIGDDIVLTVTKIERGQVRIGIDAPRSVQIIRDDAKKKEPKHATGKTS